MPSVPLFVGLDYHDEEVQVCALSESGEVVLNRKVANRARAIRAAVEVCGEVRRVAIESCCGAANLADELITKGRWPVQLAHPGFVARMKHSRDKTDRQDAKVLADLVRVGYLPQVWLAPETLRQLRRLVRFRQQLVDDRRNVKLRIRALLRENRLSSSCDTGPWTKRWKTWLRDEATWSEDDRWLVCCQLERLEQLDAQIKSVETRLQQRADADPLMQRLLALPGVGLITAVTLRAEIGRFDRFRTGKQLARFCGLSPRNASSGQRQADAGLIRAGNPLLRSVIIELAHRLIFRRDPRWGQLGYQLMQRGKPGNVAVAAVANRWVRWLFHEAQRPLPSSDQINLSSGSTKGGPPLPPSPSPRPTEG